jgi:ABC-type nitrate/sulfonate/bicarbonate transport system permease component
MTPIFEPSEIVLVLQNSYCSITRVFFGVAAALAIGISLGLLRSALPDGVKKSIFLKFFFEAPKFPPPIAWIPFVILAFGIGEVSAYTIVFIGAFSPIFTSSFDGAESVPMVIRNTAKSLEIRGIRYLFRIVLFSALPRIFTGIRVGISMGWMSVIAAEMISGQSGLGYSIQLNRLNLDYTMMVLDMLLIGIIGWFLYEIVKLLEKKLLAWDENNF